MFAVARQAGFTLLELLIVLSIIAILAAISIPRYTAYKRMAFDTRAREDLRNVALAEEAYFIESERYLTCENQGCAALPGISRLSPGVILNVEAEDEGFIANSSHPQGSGRSFRWDNQSGGLQP